MQNERSRQQDLQRTQGDRADDQKGGFHETYNTISLLQDYSSRSGGEVLGMPSTS